MTEILLVSGVICGGLICLTLLSSGETVRNLVDRLFMIPLGVPEMVRNGSRTVIDKTRAFTKASAESTGLCGEHAVQRIIGAIILTLCTILGIGVSILTLILTLMGAYGAGENELIGMLPLSVETLMAIELVAGLILFGVLLLDVLGTTHVTKFFSADNLSKAKKYVYGGIFGAGLVASITLLGIGGVMRGMSYQSTPVAEAATDTAGVSVGGGGVEITPETELESTVPEIPEGYTRALKTLTVGIPVTSAVAGTAGAVGIIPFLAMLIQLPLFFIITLGFGIIWAVSYCIHVIINLIYNFCYQLANIFIAFGETLKARMAVTKNPQTPPPQPNQPVEHQQAASEHQTHTPGPGTSSTTDTPPPPPPPGDESLYAEKDANWNPIG